MGLSLRIFLVEDDDSLHRLPLARYERLLRGKAGERISQYAGKRIRYALVVVDLLDRRPVEIVHTEFSWLSLDSEGRLDRSGQEDEIRLAMQSISSVLEEDDSEQVVDARHRFAKKRYDHEYRWKPSRAIKAAIAAAIFPQGSS
jgi:hypothetical protein